MTGLVWRLRAWRSRRARSVAYWFSTTLHDAHLRHRIDGATAGCSCALAHNRRPAVGQTYPTGGPS